MTWTRLRRVWTGSIRRQLVLGVVVLQSALMALFAVNLINRQQAFLHDRAMVESQALVSALAVSSMPWVLSSDLMGLEEVLRALAGFPELRYAMILGTDGRVLAHTQTGVAGQYVADPVSLKLLTAAPAPQTLVRSQTAIDIAAPLLLEGQAMGWARIGVGQDANRAELDRVVRQGIVFTLAAMAIGALFAVLMARSLTSGLYNLKAAADAFVTGRRDWRAPQDRADEVGRLAADFNHLLDTVNHDQQALAETMAALRQSNAELEQFTYVASHDLRQPLRTIISYLSLTEKALPKPASPDLLEYMAFVRGGAKRMDALIVSLLEYSRIGRITRPFEPVALDEVVGLNLLDLSVAIEEAGAVVTAAPGLPTIAGDRRELSRLFQNLIGNAVKYRHPDRAPLVNIDWRDGDEEWIIRVQDNGCGIDARDYERAFTIFQRLVPQDHNEGTGIGLAVCRKIADHHKGRIWIESVVGEGSVFSVAFPKIPPEDAPPPA